MPQAKSSTVTRLWSARPLRDGEAPLQDVVDGADDEVHHRRRRVVDAAALAHGRVVGLEIVLVEIDERVALEQPVLFLVLCPHPAADRLAAAERQVFVDGGEIEPVDDGQDLVDDPARVVVFGLGQLPEEVDQLPDQPERAGDVAVGVLQRHRLAPGRVQPRQEQPVGQHLGEGVGKLLDREFVKNLLAEHLVEPEQAPLAMLRLLPDKLAGEEVAQEPGARGERQGKFFGASDALRGHREEAGDQFAGGFDALGRDAKRAALQFMLIDEGRVVLHACAVKPHELAVVGEQDIVG